MASAREDSRAAEDAHPDHGCLTHDRLWRGPPSSRRRGGGGITRPRGTARFLRKPALVITRWLALREARVRLVRVGCLLLDACVVAQRSLVHAVAAPVRTRRVFAGADREHNGGPVPGSENDVLRPCRTVHEVPLSQRALLALDDQQRLAGEH